MLAGAAAGAWPKAPEGFKVERYAEQLDEPREIRTAPNGDLFLSESHAGRVEVFRGITSDGKPDRIPLKLSTAVAPLTILVNGMPAPLETRDHPYFQPDGPGFARVTVIDAAGASDSVVVRLDDGASTLPSLHSTAAACLVAPCRP